MTTKKLISLSAMALAVSVASASAQEIPRTEAGVPDFTGVYGAVAPDVAPDPFAQGNVASMLLNSRDNTLFSFEADAAILDRAEEHRPIYAPEYWDDVRYNDLHGNEEDPTFSCMPPGVFRLSAPAKIVQTDSELILLYTDNTIGNGYRVVPIDGREPNDFLAAEIGYNGYSLGEWEGDKLIIESTAFNGEVWIGWAGFITSEDLRVVEEMWWEDGKLKWQATAYDSMLLEPFKSNVRTLTPNENPTAALLPAVPCDDRDLQTFQNIGSTIRG